MANGFQPQVPNGLQQDDTARPPTGGPSTLDQGPGPQSSPSTFSGLPGGGGGVSGFGGGGPPPPTGGGGFTPFTPVQGAGFNVPTTPGNVTGSGFGLSPGGFQQPNVLTQGFVGPNAQFPTGNIATGTQNFLNTGQGGFAATPRTLNDFEITRLNQELGIAGTTEQFQGNAFRTRQLLGPFGFIADPSTFNRSQLPGIETGLNFQQLLQSQQDRAASINLLQEQRSQIGQRPEQLQALDVARRRLERPEPFTPEEVSQQQSAIRQRGAQSFESAQRQQDESLARQGLRGGVTAFQEAGLRQQSSRQTSDELQRLAIENALGRDVNEAQAVDRLRLIGGEDEARTIAVNNALTELLSAERGPIDLSALAGFERKSERGLLSKIGFF